MQDDVADELARLQGWSLADLEKLKDGLEALIRQRVFQTGRRSILAFEGMDRDSWQGVDVREYLDRERNSWGESVKPEDHSIMELKGFGKELWQGIDVESI